VEFAFAEAALRKAPLVALHAWTNAWTTWNAPLPPQDAAAPYAHPPGTPAQGEQRPTAGTLVGSEGE
jgi:hypothetical protein